jgi:hypothetical protein
MPVIKIFAKNEIIDFNTPPHFTARDHEKFFYIDKGARNYLNQIRASKNKVGFMLQLGYFKATGQFYHPRDWRNNDISYVIKILGASCNSKIVRTYSVARAHAHKRQ